MITPGDIKGLVRRQCNQLLSYVENYIQVNAEAIRLRSFTKIVLEKAWLTPENILVTDAVLKDAGWHTKWVVFHVEQFGPRYVGGAILTVSAVPILPNNRLLENGD